MKFLLLLLMVSCTQKYQTYPVIKKSSFNKDEAHNPVSPKIYPGRKVTQESCEGQFFFLRNAKKITDASLPALVNFSCPGSEYLVNAKITETWWTTVIYSRSCIEVESHCPIKGR